MERCLQAGNHVAMKIVWWHHYCRAWRRRLTGPHGLSTAVGVVNTAEVIHLTRFGFECDNTPVDEECRRICESHFFIRDLPAAVAETQNQSNTEKRGSRCC
jgi:hypothetical protein